ncbi:MAG: hypothetical protein P4L16_07815 [Chlamydiales bacterium]|nr:hypothetical protein [Chlamydiales bacterium]
MSTDYLVPLCTLERINSLHDARELFAYTFTQQGTLEPVFGNWIGYVVAWVLDKLYIRTNQQLAIDAAFYNLSILKDSLARAKEIPSAMDDLKDRIQSFSVESNNYTLWIKSPASMILIEEIKELATKKIPRDPGAPKIPSPTKPSTPADRKPPPLPPDVPSHKPSRTSLTSRFQESEAP